MPVKVLAIDDDPAMTELLILLLRARGFEVYTANSGEDGIKKMSELSPDVLILDLMMSGVDGWEVCSKVRKFSTTPILILSALDTPGMVASALDAGADDYLIKPVPNSVLIAHLHNLARRARMIKPKQEIITKPLAIY